ncbi:MAG: right-handed parallel beta-helix repeat-containing protein [bacterium]
MLKDSVVLGLIFILVIMGLITVYAPLGMADIHIYPGQVIQPKIGVAKDGDVIVVHPGTYYENINFSGKAITLRGTDPTDPDIVAATIIDGNQVDRVIIFDHGEGGDSILSGLTVRNGKMPSLLHGGGGIYCEGTSPGITYCIITDNSATLAYINGGGGGIYCNKSSPSISHCAITNNSAWDGGGIYCTDFSFPIIKHCVFNGNLSENTGGAIFCNESFPCITNCTVTGNFTEGAGGAMFCTGSSSPYIVNCIFRGNGTEIYIEDYCNPRFSYCNIQGGYTGVGNIDAVPGFVDPANGDFRLGSGSLCIDAGHPRMSDGNGSRSDMGEYGGEGGWETNTIAIKVADDGSGNYASIQDAVDYAVPGDTINVFSGIYKENLVIGGKALSLVSQDGAESTFIDGSGLGSVVAVVNLDGGVLDGFTLRNGFSERSTGGIGCYRSSLSIMHCTVRDNSSRYGGGVLFKYSDSASINDCDITGNQVEVGFGGGIYCDHSSPDITRCTIAGNLANGGTGGGFYCESDSSPRITDCIIAKNSAGLGGGFYCESDSSPEIINCTIYENSAAYLGGGIYCEYEALPNADKPEVTNSFLWSNTGEGNTDQITFYDTSIEMSYTNMQVVNYEENDRILFQKFNELTGKWKAVYRFFGKTCNKNIEVESGEILFISLMPK